MVVMIYTSKGLIMKTRNAFTMVELVFVIVIIGILSAVAVPKLAPIMNNAKTAKARDTLSAVRGSLATERQKRILRGTFTHIYDLGEGTNAFSYFDSNTSGTRVLEYDVPACVGSARSCWERTAGTAASPAKFVYRFPGNVDAKYKLDKSRLVCDDNTSDCAKLLK